MHLQPIAYDNLYKKIQLKKKVTNSLYLKIPIKAITVYDVYLKKVVFILRQLQNNPRQWTIINNISNFS